MRDQHSMQRFMFVSNNFKVSPSHAFFVLFDFARTSSEYQRNVNAHWSSYASFHNSLLSFHISPASHWQSPLFRFFCNLSIYKSYLSAKGPWESWIIIPARDSVSTWFNNLFYCQGISIYKYTERSMILFKLVFEKVAFCTFLFVLVLVLSESFCNILQTIVLHAWKKKLLKLFFCNILF